MSNEDQAAKGIVFGHTQGVVKGTVIRDEGHLTDYVKEKQKSSVVGSS